VAGFVGIRKDPEYVGAYDGLEDEFAVASALINARGDADMTPPGRWVRRGHLHDGTLRLGDPYALAVELRAGEPGRVREAVRRWTRRRL
jgi:hypothetical protein